MVAAATVVQAMELFEAGAYHSKNGGRVTAITQPAIDSGYSPASPALSFVLVCAMESA